MRNTFWLSFVIALFISAIIVANFDKEEFLNKIQASGLLGPMVEINELEFQEAFMDFIATYQKSYLNSFEFENRYLTFKKNYQAIADHNVRKEELGFELKINQFGDLSLAEFKDKFLGLKTPRKTFADFLKERNIGKTVRQNARPLEALQDIPASVDWTTSGAVQKVKNQGSCGSCWAFSAVGAIESAYAIKTGTLPNLSEQQLVDCSGSYGNEGCNGGFMDWAFQYAEKDGLCTQTDYPYKGRDQACKINAGVTCAQTYPVQSYYDVTTNSNDELRTAISKGPVSIGVCAESIGWQFYFKGVLSTLCGGCQDHGVLAVGYGYGGWLSNTDYIKIKNSWGTGWGESGYIRVYAQPHETGKGTCGIYESPSAPVV